MNMIRQLLGNHNHTHTSNSASPSLAHHHQSQQKRGKNHGGAYAWGGGGQDDNSSITTGITEFSRSMSRDASLPLQHSDILEESCSDSDNNIIHNNSTHKMQNGSGNIHLRARSSSFDAKANFSHQSNNTSTRHPRSRSSSNNNKSRRRKKNKDQEKVALNQMKKKEMCFTLNTTPNNAVAPPPPPQPQCNDTIEFIDLKDPAPTNPTTTKNKEDEESVEVEEYVMALLEEYQHEIKRLERLNATLTANLETLTAAALLNGGGEENNSCSTTTPSTTTTTAHTSVTTPQPCPNCSHCGSGSASSGGGSGSGSTSNPPPPRRESSSSNDNIYHDMMLTETHYLSKISKLQKSNHKLTSELERKKKLISQLLLNLSMAADKIKELSSGIGSENKKKIDREGAILLLGKGQSTDDDDDARGHVNGNCAVGRDGRGGMNHDEASSSSSMQQIRQYQIQVIENELQSLLQVMSARSDSHAQRRHALIDEYRRHGDHHHHSMEKRRLDETPEEILQRVIRNLRGGDDNMEKEGEGYGTEDVMTTEQQQQVQLGAEVTHPPPPPVATSMAEKETPPSSSLKNNIGGGAGIWDSVTSLFYGSGQTLSQALPQCHEEQQLLQSKEVVPSLEIQKHPLCEEVESFDKNCLRKASPNTNTIGWGQEEVDETSRSHSTYVKAVESFAKSTTTTPDTAAHSFAVHTSSNDDVSTNSPLMKCQEEIDGVVNAVDGVNTNTSVLDDGSLEDKVCGYLKSDDNSLGNEVHLERTKDSIGSFVAEVERECAGAKFIPDVPVLTKEYLIDEAREVENGIVDVRTHENINMEEGDGIVKTEGIESDPQSGLTNTRFLLEDCVEEDDGDGNIINVPDSYGIDLVNPSHEEDDSAELYTAKEPKDEGESLEQAVVRSGDIVGEYNDFILENEPIIHDGDGDDNHRLLDDKDENGEINENGGFECSYIGIVSLSNANLVPAREQLKDDKPLKGSTFEQNLLQLSSTPAHGGKHTNQESIALSPTLPASTPTSEKWTSKPSIDLAAAELVEKMVVGNKTLSETLGSIQGNRLARFDDSIDDRSMMYHHSITSFYRKPSHTNSYGDDSLSTRLGRKQLFQHQGSLDLSDIQPDVYGDWQILVKSKDNDKYFVPRYKTPVLPPQSVNKAVPLFKKGLKDGHYRYASSSGNEYSGHWVNGKRHGYGVAKYHDGEIYHGQWRRGRRHGHGVLHLSNREVFDGYWSSNKKHGLGMYFWTDGEVDISWYQDDVRLESLRWTSDRRRAFRLDLASSKKEQISLARAADKVRDWERKRETDVD